MKPGLPGYRSNAKISLFLNARETSDGLRAGHTEGRSLQGKAVEKFAPGHQSTLAFAAKSHNSFLAGADGSDCPGIARDSTEQGFFVLLTRMIPAKTLPIKACFAISICALSWPFLCAADPAEQFEKEILPILK